MRISDWSSDVCSSDLSGDNVQARLHPAGDDVHHLRTYRRGDARRAIAWKPSARHGALLVREYEQPLGADIVLDWHALRSEEHTSELQSIMRISYAVLCLKKTQTTNKHTDHV